MLDSSGHLLPARPAALFLAILDTRVPPASRTCMPSPLWDLVLQLVRVPADVFLECTSEGNTDAPGLPWNFLVP